VILCLRWQSLSRFQESLPQVFFSLPSSSSSLSTLPSSSHPLLPNPPGEQLADLIELLISGHSLANNILNSFKQIIDKACTTAQATAEALYRAQCRPTIDGVDANLRASESTARNLALTSYKYAVLFPSSKFLVYFSCTLEAKNNFSPLPLPPSTSSKFLLFLPALLCGWTCSSVTTHRTLLTNVIDNNLSTLLANNKALRDRQEAERLHQERQCAQQEREAAKRRAAEARAQARQRQKADYLAARERTKTCQRYHSGSKNFREFGPLGQEGGVLWWE